MIFALVFIALVTQALGLWALLISIHRAPEGHEDEAGFHFSGLTPRVTSRYDSFAGGGHEDFRAHASSSTHPAAA